MIKSELITAIAKKQIHLNAQDIERAINCIITAMTSPFKVFLEDNYRFQNDSIQQRVTKIHQ